MFRRGQNMRIFYKQFTVFCDMTASRSRTRGHITEVTSDPFRAFYCHSLKVILRNYQVAGKGII
jgi:hypothetical protein